MFVSFGGDKWREIEGQNGSRVWDNTRSRSREMAMTLSTRLRVEGSTAAEGDGDVAATAIVTDLR